MTGRLPNERFMVGSVNVNITVVRVTIPWLQSVKPQDSGHDQILRARNLSGCLDRAPAPENSANRLAGPDFFGNPKSARRCLPASFGRAETEPRSRDRESTLLPPTAEDRELLLRHRYPNGCERTFLHAPSG